MRLTLGIDESSLMKRAITGIKAKAGLPLYGSTFQPSEYLFADEVKDTIEYDSEGNLLEDVDLYSDSGVAEGEVCIEDAPVSGTVSDTPFKLDYSFLGVSEDSLKQGNAGEDEFDSDYEDDYDLYEEDDDDVFSQDEDEERILGDDDVLDEVDDDEVEDDLYDTDSDSLEEDDYEEEDVDDDDSYDDELEYVGIEESEDFDDTEFDDEDEEDEDVGYGEDVEDDAGSNGFGYVSDDYSSEYVDLEDKLAELSDSFDDEVEEESDDTDYFEGSDGSSYVGADVGGTYEDGTDSVDSDDDLELDESSDEEDDLYEDDDSYDAEDLDADDFGVEIDDSDYLEDEDDVYASDEDEDFDYSEDEDDVYDSRDKDSDIYAEESDDVEELDEDEVADDVDWSDDYAESEHSTGIDGDSVAIMRVDDDAESDSFDGELDSVISSIGRSKATYRTVEEFVRAKNGNATLDEAVGLFGSKAVKLSLARNKIFYKRGFLII